jgi:hypothetical protein
MQDRVLLFIDSWVQVLVAEETDNISDHQSAM